MTTLPAPDLATSLASIADTSTVQARASLKFKSMAKSSAENFEAMFLNAMFEHMFTGINGDGPFGGGGAAGVWRSFLTDEYAKSFAKAGGIGIADQVYRSLLAQQEARR